MGKEIMLDKEAMMTAIFSGSTESTEGADNEKVIYVSPDNLVDFHSNELGKQPYQVRRNKDFLKLVESVATLGVFEPLLVRPDNLEIGKYEVVSGHRRKTAACEVATEKIPILIRNISDDEANILVCDANLHREDILPSEKAWAYRLKLESMNRQGRRTDLTCDPLGDKLRSVDILASDSDDSKTQIQRYIRLTYLIHGLLEMMDENKIKLRTGVELSFLKTEEQKVLLGIIACENIIPSMEQAVELKQMSKEMQLTQESIHFLLKKKDEAPVKLTATYINKLLPEAVKEMTVEKKASFLEKAIEYYNLYLQNHLKD